MKTNRQQIFALVGPDGVGKTSAALAVQRDISRITAGVKIRHWRPGVLPNLKVLFRPANQPDLSLGTAPRRTAGRFHWLRVFYYFLDYLVGYPFKDRVDTRRGNVVLYDRHALDMAVDPLRYGLSSTKGLGTLSRLIRHPDLSLLLYDRPDRIVARKAELTPEEIREIFERWLAMLENGRVQAVVRAQSDVASTADCISSLLKDSWETGAKPATGESEPLHEIDWATALVGEKSDPGLEVRRFALVSRLTRERLLIDLTNPRVAEASLELYNAQTSLARICRKTLSGALRRGWFQPFLKAEFSGPPPDLSQKLAGLLGRREIFFAAASKRRGCRPKSVLQAMNRRGEILAYVRIAWDTHSKALLENESQSLERLNEHAIRSAQIPRVLALEPWKDALLLATSAPPGITAAPPRRLSWLHLDFINELTRLDGRLQRLEESEFWRDLQRRISLLEGGRSYDAHLLRWGSDHIARHFQGRKVSLGWRHGDFAPWNTKLSGGKLFVFDWELSRPDAPSAWDLFHFVLASSVLLEKVPRGDLLKRVLTDPLIRGYFEANDIDTRETPRYLILYLLDVIAGEIEWCLATGFRFQEMVSHWQRCLTVLLLHEELFGSWRCE